MTHNQTVSLDAGSLVAGVAFNSDGTKVLQVLQTTWNM